MKRIKILCIGHHLSKLENICKLFDNVGIEIVYITRDGDVYKSCKLFVPDIIVLNLNTLDSDFYKLLLVIRNFDFKIPIILNSSSKDESFYIKVLRAGIDICVMEGNSDELFLLQIKSLINVLVRHKFNYVNEIKLGEVSFYNIVRRELHVDNMLYKLTSLEGRLFHVLCYNLNKVTYRNVLLLAGWGSDHIQYDLQLNKYIVKFRKFLSTSFSIKLITIKGYGYRLEIN